MSTERFNHMMALWTKGKEFETETNMDGSIVVYPKHDKESVYAVINPDKMSVHYYMNFSEPVRSTYIPVDEVEDLKYFVSLLMEDD